jgi:hypothetical protein
MIEPSLADLSETIRMRMSLSTYIEMNRLFWKILRLKYKKNSINLFRYFITILHSIVDEIKFVDAVKWRMFIVQTNLKFNSSSRITSEFLANYQNFRILEVVSDDHWSYTLQVTDCMNLIERRRLNQTLFLSKLELVNNMYICDI